MRAHAEADGGDGVPSNAVDCNPARRRFVLVMHSPPPPCACSFRLTALDQGRMDLVCRCMSSVRSLHSLPVYVVCHAA